MRNKILNFIFESVKYLGILILMFVFLFFNIYYSRSASPTITKTVEFLATSGTTGTDTIVRATAAASCFDLSVNLAETPTLLNSFLEVSGISYHSSGSNIFNVDVQQNATCPGTPGAGVNYTLANSGPVNPKQFKILHSTYSGGSGIMSNIIAADTIYNYAITVKGTATGGIYSIYSVKVKITYTSGSSSANKLKTTTFWVTQQAGPITSGTNTSQNFNVSILENSPVIRSKFVEVTGILKGTTQFATAEVSVVKQGNPLSYTLYNLDLTATAGIITPFTILYPISNVEMPDSDFPTTRNYQFDFKGTGFDTYVLQARAIITYKFSSGAGLYQAFGTLESSVFDTATANGASFNSVSWNGVLNSGAVQFQLATSDCSGGQTNPPTCNTGTWTFYGDAGLGSGCNTTDFYDLSGVIGLDKAKSLLSCAANINNKRYFKYKTKLCSASNCVSQTAFTPQVNDILVNWAP